MLRQDSTKRYNQLAVGLLKKILIKQNYQEEIRSYGNEFENDGTVNGKRQDYNLIILNGAA